VDTYFNLSDDSENDILDSDSDVHTTRLCKQLQPSAVGFTSDSETRIVEERSKLESSDDKTSDKGCKTD
jgi:hypothetical protein